MDTPSLDMPSLGPTFGDIGSTPSIDTSIMTPIPTSLEVGGLTPVDASLDIGSSAAPPSSSLPEACSPPKVESPNTDPPAYDILMEKPSSPPPPPAISTEATLHPESPLTLEAIPAPSHLSTCNMMNGSQLAEKTSESLCQASCMFVKNCGTGHCEMRGDQPTCVCGRCDVGPAVKVNVYLGGGK